MELASHMGTRHFVSPLDFPAETPLVGDMFYSFPGGPYATIASQARML